MPTLPSGTPRRIEVDDCRRLCVEGLNGKCSAIIAERKHAVAVETRAFGVRDEIPDHDLPLSRAHRPGDQ